MHILVNSILRVGRLCSPRQHINHGFMHVVQEVESKGKGSAWVSSLKYGIRLASGILNQDVCRESSTGTCNGGCMPRLVKIWECLSIQGPSWVLTSKDMDLGSV